MGKKDRGETENVVYYTLKSESRKKRMVPKERY